MAGPCEHVGLLIVLVITTLDSTWYHGGVVHCILSNPDAGVLSDERYVAGKAKYESLQRESTMPKYSHCWLDALQSLEYGCKHLDEDVQHRLALKFTNCFLKRTGRGTYECPDTELLEVCTRDMAPEAYNTYIEFFTHTQNICFFLQAQRWQEDTEHTIDMLSDNSALVAQQLEDSSQLQSQVILKQNESIQNQQVLLERGLELKHTLEESTVDVSKMLQEFKDSTSEQRTLISEVFDRINSLQNIVMGEFTGFYSLIFYAVSIVVCYILTSTPRTSGARFWLFVLMTANIVVERLIVMWGAEQYEDISNGTITDGSTIMYKRLWWCRKVFSVAAILAWLRCAYVFCDMNRINNQLLVEIRKQNSDLKHLLQTGTPKSTPVEKSPIRDIGGPKMNLVETWMKTADLDATDSKESKATTGSTTGYETDSYTDESSSFNSVMTDRTFTMTRDLADISESDTESFSTWRSESSLFDELNDLRDSTPFRELMSSTPDLDVSLNISEISGPSTPRRRGRPKGSKNKTRVSDAPCPYNLRSHLGVTKITPNPVIHTESAEDFGKMVKHLSQVSDRNRVKTEITLEARGKGALFSSDDD